MSYRRLVVSLSNQGRYPDHLIPLENFSEFSYYLGMLKCPSCNAMLYSRASGACPECHAPLPPEMQPTEEEKRKRDLDNQSMRMWVELNKQTRSKNPIKKMLG